MVVVQTQSIRKAMQPPKISKEDRTPKYDNNESVVTKVKEQSEAAQEFIRRQAQIALARQRFYYYCKAKEPHFYCKEAKYLETFCDTLQAIWEKRVYTMNIAESKSIHQTKWEIAPTVEDIPEGAYVCSKVMINMPPQRLKTRTLTHFSCWVLGKNPKYEHIGCVSYNDVTASDMSKYTRDEIAEKKNGGYIAFSDVFPEVKLNPKDKSVERWALLGSHFSYLSAGWKGGVTGKGFTIRIADDLIKNAEEAFNENECDKINSFISDTWASRKDLSVKEALDIMVMTRWSEFDPCQKVIDNEYGKYYYHICFKEYDSEKDQMLCDKFGTKEDYDRLLSTKVGDVALAVFYANYNQEIIVTGKSLYGNNFKTYEEMPLDKTGHPLSMGRKAYVDVADKGSDYLCAVAFNEWRGTCYVYDVLYTQDPQSITEGQMVDFVINNRLTEITFESNNGGGEFGRHIEEKVRKKGYYSCKFKYVWNRTNKFTRILTAQNDVLTRIIFPVEWQKKWQQFAVDIKKFQKIEKDNKHDDCADCLTGIVSQYGIGSKSVRARVG